MKVNIYYGGRGLIEDPTLYVIQKLTEVLKEIRVEVVQYNLYEDKNGISVLPNTLKDADGVILAVSLEWIGIGGLMMQFLDSCWLYADKEKMKQLYMMPVVMASTYGEREAEYTLIRAWEMLGGIPVEGICAYVEDHVDFETDVAYSYRLEKKAEALYRNMSQKSKAFPSSANAVKARVLKNKAIELTPQESEQLSRYVSNDTYVKKQKKDIEELAMKFKGMLGDHTEEEQAASSLQKHFFPQDGVEASYEIKFTDTEQSLVIEVKGDSMTSYMGVKEDADVHAKTQSGVWDAILHGEKTFQGAFMAGDVAAQGDFRILRIFDSVFHFAS